MFGYRFVIVTLDEQENLMMDLCCFTYVSLRVDFEENFFEKNCLFFCFKVFTDHINGTRASKMCFSQKQDKAVFLATKSRFRSFDITNAERNPKGVNHGRDFAVALSDH